MYIVKAFRPLAAGIVCLGLVASAASAGPMPTMRASLPQARPANGEWPLPSWLPLAHAPQGWQLNGTMRDDSDASDGLQCLSSAPGQDQADDASDAPLHAQWRASE